MLAGFRGGRNESAMARMLRIQYDGAIYHVINRGNYRLDVFESAGAAYSFEQTLAEACLLFEWRLHAYAIMRNHFHLALETPRPNLVEGMHWLQGTFASRFNRFRKEQGHLFQGRYKALLIEDAASLIRVIHYIHLNPVRAKIVAPELCAAFRWGSMAKLRMQPRPAWLVAEVLLSQTGLPDSSRGWRQYAEYLAELAVDSAEQEKQGFGRLSAGWAIGTQAWKGAVARDCRTLALNPGLEAREMKEIREHLWRDLLGGVLTSAGKSDQEVAADPPDAPWKVAVASQMRLKGVPYGWIAQSLRMGAANKIRAQVHHHRVRGVS